MMTKSKSNRLQKKTIHVAPKLEELVGSGNELANDIMNAKRKGSGQTLIKRVKPSFSARAKAAMIQGRK
jgi:hypothetical protein